MVVLTRSQLEAIEERERLGDNTYRDKVIARAEKQQKYSSYKGAEPKIVSSSSIKDDTPVGVYDLEKSQTEEVPDYEASVIKAISSKQSLQSTETNPQTVNQYLEANQGKPELLYFQSTDEEFKATAIAKARPPPAIPKTEPKKEVDKSQFTPDGKISASKGFLVEGVEGYKDAFFGAFKEGFSLKPYSGGTGNLRTEGGITNLGYGSGAVLKTITLSPAVWEGLGYNVAKYTVANPQYEPYLTGVGNFFSSRPIKTTLWTLYGTSRAVDLAEQTRADGSVGFARSGLGTTAGLSPVLGIGRGVRDFQSTIQTTPYIDSIKLDTVAKGGDFKSLLTTKGGVIVGSEGQTLRVIPYKEATTLTGSTKNLQLTQLGKSKISLDKVQIDSRGITNLGGNINKVNTQYKVVSGSNVETVTNPLIKVTESGKATKYTIDIGKTANVYDVSKVTGSADDVISSLSKTIGKDKTSFVSLNYGSSSQIDGVFKGSVGKTNLKYPYSENVNIKYDLLKFSTGNTGAGTIQTTQTSGGAVSKLRTQEILSNLQKATNSLTNSQKTAISPISITETPKVDSPSGGFKTPTVATTKTETTSKTYNIIAPVSFSEPVVENKTSINPITEPKPITENLSENITRSRSRSSSRNTPSTENIVRARSDVETQQESITRQRQNIITESTQAKAKTNITSLNFKTILTPPPASGFGLPPPSLKPASGTTGFNVLVKSKGIFKRVNPVPLSQADAINYGARRVGTTASATFKLQKTGEAVKDTTSTKGNIRDFYRKGNLFIEKRGRRIKSSGELREITYKGLASPKKKKRKNLFGGFKSGIF